MNCKLAVDNLKALMEGELPADEARETRRHLLSCPSCSAGLSPEEWVEILPGMEEEVEPSSDFAREFYRKLDRRREAGRTRRWSIPWGRPMRLAGAGALVLAVLMGVMLVRLPWDGRTVSGPAVEPGMEETVAILKDMGVLHHLDLLEDFETIADLGALAQDEGFH
ncbi:MAG: zf-HC2 domain-containing protein [Acidobacteria bacterium]|nr:zf-HC2 domain-containing protein [Acidobacteriota bacterium]